VVGRRERIDGFSLIFSWVHNVYFTGQIATACVRIPQGQMIVDSDEIDIFYHQVWKAVSYVVACEEADFSVASARIT